MQKAVFLDRDGVINQNVRNPKTKEWESPHTPNDFLLLPNAIPSLRRLADHGFSLFLVSNQPSYAKGKTTLENIKLIHEKLLEYTRRGGVHFRECYYCYHHPDGTVQAYTKVCPCRKPEPYFLNQARMAHGLDMDRSWMVGDRMSDVECGHRAGVKTILIQGRKAGRRGDSSQADFTSRNLKDAATIIIEKDGKDDANKYRTT